MKKKSSVLITALFSLGLTATLPALGAWPASVNNQPLPSLAPMIEQISPAVVSVSVEGFYSGLKKDKEQYHKDNHNMRASSCKLKSQSRCGMSTYILIIYHHFN